MDDEQIRTTCFMLSRWMREVLGDDGMFFDMTGDDKDLEREVAQHKINGTWNETFKTGELPK